MESAVNKIKGNTGNKGMAIITDAVYKEMWDELKDKVDIPDIDKDVFTLICLLYTSPSPRDGLLSRMPSSA